MKNYIYLNGQQIALTEEQIEQIKASFGVPVVRLREVKPGDTVKIGDHEMVVLEQSGDATALICKNFVKTCKFGDSNNYDGSNVDAVCSEFATELAKIVGEDNVILHTVDLTADDGLKDYGSVKRFASLLTADLYRRYVYTLDKHSPQAWWWLATAYSTPAHGYDSIVKCVAPSGFFSRDNCINDNGVRPFCILNSNIFVSN